MKTIIKSELTSKELMALEAAFGRLIDRNFIKKETQTEVLKEQRALLQNAIMAPIGAMEFATDISIRRSGLDTWEIESTPVNGKTDGIVELLGFIGSPGFMTLVNVLVPVIKGLKETVIALGKALPVFKIESNNIVRALEKAYPSKKR